LRNCLSFGDSLAQCGLDHLGHRDPVRADLLGEIIR
jgi:hypothetical protein